MDYRKIDILSELREAVSFNCTNPALQVQRVGRVLVGLGQALEGRPEHDAKGILRAVLELDSY